MNKLIQLFAAGVLCAAASLSQAAVLTHDYELNGAFTDAFGGPSLVSLGGTLNATNYSFGANQGLSLSNALPSAGNDYSIEMRFSFDQLTGYRKILDFKNRASDNGFYNRDAALVYFLGGPIGSGADFVAGTLADVILTRDAATNTVVGYFNGVQQFSFTDSTNDAVFDTANNIMNFFIDDLATGGGEASRGAVDFICIYSGALTANQAGARANATGCTPGGNTVPEPAPLALFGIAAMAFGLSRRRKI